MTPANNDGSYPENVVNHIQKGRVTILNVSPDMQGKLIMLGAEIANDEHRGLLAAVIVVEPDTDKTLATLLGQLRDLNLPFVMAPSGWPPAAIFEDLCDKGLLEGPFQTVTWHGPGNWHIASK